MSSNMVKVLANEFLYAKMAGRLMGSCQDGHLSRPLLPWVLLAIFSINGCSRLDELAVDGIVCRNKKTWSRHGIWIARFTGVGFVIAGLFALLGIFSPQNNNSINTMQNSSSGSSSGNTPTDSKSNDNNMTNMKGMYYIIARGHGQNQEWFVI